MQGSKALKKKNPILRNRICFACMCFPITVLPLKPALDAAGEALLRVDLVVPHVQQNP